MPLFVISSRGVGWITTRSPSGRSFVVDAVAVANVQSSWDAELAPASLLDGLGRSRHRLVSRTVLAGASRALW
jgi:hypothetical protein